MNKFYTIVCKVTGVPAITSQASEDNALISNDLEALKQVLNEEFDDSYEIVQVIFKKI